MTRAMERDVKFVLRMVRMKAIEGVIPNSEANEVIHTIISKLYRKNSITRDEAIYLFDDYRLWGE